MYTTFYKIQITSVEIFVMSKSCWQQTAGDHYPDYEVLIFVFNFHSTRRRVPVNTRAIMDFNFGAAPLGDDSCVVHLNLQNTGSVPAEW